MSIRKIGIVMLIICALSLCCGSLFATTYYVATNGSYDNPGTEAAPWATIFDGDHKKVLRPGDTVIVKEGEYTVSGRMNDYEVRLIECDGAPGSPITYKADGDVRIINDGSMNTGHNTTSCCVHVSSNYVVLDGFELIGGSTPLGVNHKATDLVVKNCKIHDSDYLNNMMPMAAGIYQECSSCNLTVENCEIYNIGNSANQDIGCAAIYTMGGWDADNPAQETYHHNYFHNIGNGQCPGFGIWVRGGGTNDLVYNNTFTDCRAAVRTNTGARTHGTATAMNNIIANCGMAFQAEAVPGSVTNSYNLIYNCGSGNVAIGANTLTSDPCFTEAPEIAFYSPAINAGTDLGYPYSGAAPDMGCFESNYSDYGTIAGVVTDTNGTPLSGMMVYASAEFYGYTDADGSYSFRVDPGSYTVDVLGAGYDRASNTVNANVQRGATVNANFTMVPAVHTFYVSPYGDDNNPGTQDEPWATIDNGDKKNLLGPGDTVIVMEGEYYPSDYHGFTFRNCAGTADAPITYEAEDGVLVNDIYFVYDAFPNGQVDQVPAAMAIRTSNVVFKNFEVANFNVAFIITGGTGLSGIVIDGCDIHDAHAFTSGLDPACCGIYVDPSKNSVEVKNCRIHDFPNWAAFMDMTSHETGEAPDHGTFKFHHNYVYNITGYGSWIRGYVDDQIYNNTFYNVTGNVIVATALTGNSSPVVKNNIFVNCGTALDGHDAGCTIVNSNNLFYNTTPTTGGAVLGENNITEDPQFTDAESGDFSISDMSPAVNAGVDVGLPYNGTAPDLGAYETDLDVSKTGRIVGHVTGTYNGTTYPAGGVTIVAGDNSVITDASGNYSMLVPVGRYTVSAPNGARFTCTSGSVTVNVTPDGEVTADFSGTITFATYYVSPAGDDSNDGLTPDTAWANADNGCVTGIVQPGDTVVVMEGVYPLTGENNPWLINTGGTAEFPVTYVAEEGVELDCTEIAGQLISTGFRVADAGHVVFDGFEIYGPVAGFWVSNSQVEIKNCDIHDLSHTNAIFPNCAAVYLDGGSNTVADVHDNYIHDLANVYDNTAGIYDMSCFNEDATAKTGSKYYRNFFENIDGFAFHFRGTNNSTAVLNNTFVNCQRCILAWAGYGTYPAGNIAVINNIFSDCGYAFDCRESSVITSGYNLFNNLTDVNAGDAVAIGIGSINADPEFITAPVISDTSAAINNGIDVGLAFKGVAPDMGCYETDVLDYLTGTVKGTVTINGNGYPAPGVTVVCGEYSAVTDANGAYSFTMKPGSYLVNLETTGGYNYDGSSKAANVTIGSTVTVDFTVDYTTSTYYVSNTGNDENDGLSPETAWFNINAGDRKGIINPGDTVIVLEGTYTGDTAEMTGAYESRYGYRIIQSAGNEHYPVTYKAQGHVVISNELGVTAQGMAKGISVSCPYVVLDGFEVTGNETNQGIYFDYRGYNDTVKNCYVHDLGPTTAIWPRSAGAYIEGGMTAPATTVFENCTFANIGDAAGWSYGVFNMGGFWDAQGGCAIEIHHCTFYGIGGAALCSRGGMTGDKFYNNTVYSSRQGVAICNGNVTGGSADVKNNIFSDIEGNDVGAESMGVIVAFSNNLDYNVGAPTPGVATGDPMFVNAAAYNFELQQGSPAINAGVDLGYEYKGSAPDLGAYESDYSEVPVDVDSVSDLADVADGTTVNTTFELTAVNDNNTFGDGSVYGETADRLAGVKFDFSAINQAVAAGDVITVQGIVRSDADGKYIEVKQVLTQVAADVPGALGLTKTSLDTNVLVRVWGKVVSASGDTVVINNGSGDITVKGGVSSSVGDFITVTGVATKTGVRAIEVL